LQKSERISLSLSHSSLSTSLICLRPHIES
jgi:hypothetical protein